MKHLYISLGFFVGFFIWSVCMVATTSPWYLISAVWTALAFAFTLHNISRLRKRRRELDDFYKAKSEI